MVDTIEQREETELEARALLQNSPIGELRELQIECNAEHLLISGRVCCFYHKQLAQEAVRSVAGGLRVVNEVAVTS